MVLPYYHFRDCLTTNISSWLLIGFANLQQNAISASFTDLLMGVVIKSKDWKSGLSDPMQSLPRPYCDLNFSDSVDSPVKNRYSASLTRGILKFQFVKQQDLKQACVCFTYITLCDGTRPPIGLDLCWANEVHLHSLFFLEEAGPKGGSLPCEGTTRKKGFYAEIASNRGRPVEEQPWNTSLPELPWLTVRGVRGKPCEGTIDF